VNTYPTLTDWLDAQPALDASLRRLLLSVAHSCTRISETVAAGSLGNALGSLGSENVQGEVQQKLDLIANTQLMNDVSATGCVAALASEEMAQPHFIENETQGAQRCGPYLLVFDPLDGSSNIDVNVSIGTIFSVLNAPQEQVRESDFLQAGRQQVAAGYAIYGPQTMLVLTTGQGVAGFTLEPGPGPGPENTPGSRPDLRQWRLTHPHLTIPADTKEFAINMSNMRHWEAPVQRYVQDCLAGETGPRGKNYNMRWIASMVADVHRILMRGGIFLYPRDARAGSQHGKLRLLYEANPMSLLIEQAGGAAVDGSARLLDVTPQALHQRIGVVLGSRNEVARVQQYHLQPRQSPQN